MSCKIPINNGINMKCGEPQWLTKTNSLDTSIKLAGEEAKDRLYEPKHKKKLVRVLTVIAYVFFVSLAAIMLSLYYVFLWNGNQKMPAKHAIQQQTERICPEKQQSTDALEDIIDATLPQLSSSTTTTEDNTTSDYDSSLETEKFGKTKYFLRKLIYSSLQR